MQWVFVSRIEPPAARLQAVDPVGVAIIKPSPTEQVILFPSMQMFNQIMQGLGPLSMTISLTTWMSLSVSGSEFYNWSPRNTCLSEEVPGPTFTLSLNRFSRPISAGGILSFIEFKIRPSTVLWSSKVKLHIKPREPCAKVSIGGIYPVLYCLAAHRIVPSPPRVTIYSIQLLFASENIVQICLVRPIC